MQKYILPAPSHRPLILLLVIAEFESGDTVPVIEPDREVEVPGENTLRRASPGICRTS